MMDVPVLNSPSVTPSEMADGYITTRYSPTDFGAAQGQGLENAGEAVGQYAKYLKDKNDTLAVTDAMNQLSDKTNQILSDPNSGLLNMRGKDALQVPQKFQDAYEDAVGGITNKLSNINQRAAFGAMAASERRYSQMRIDQHVSNEMNQFTDQTYKTAIANATSRAISSNGSPDIIAGALDQIGALTRAQAHAQGWSDDTTQYMLSQATSQVHQGVIENMLTAGNTKLAQTYYEVNKNEIDGQYQDKIQQALKVGLLRTDATNKAQDIMAANPGDLGAQVKDADKIDDPMLHDEVVRQITMHDELLNRAREDQHQGDLQSANAIIAAGKGFNAIPPAIVARLTPGEADGYRKYANQLASGEEPPQNWGRWTDFVASVAENPGAVAKQNLMTSIRPYVDNAHYNEAVNMQKAAIEATTGGDKAKLTAIQDPMERFNNTVFPVAFPNQKSPSDLQGDDKQRYGHLISEVQGDISQQEEKMGRKLTPTELQKTMDDFVHEQVFVHGRWFGSDQKPIAALTKDEEGRAFVPMAQIPEARVGNIQNYITSAGGKVTEDKVERIYAAAMLGDDDAIKNIAKE